MKTLCIGDSNTYGYDPRSTFGSRYGADVRWTERLGEREVINCGMNGLTIPRDGRTWAARIRSRGAELVTVMLGSNDLLEGACAEETARRMEGFITGLAETGAKLLMIAPPPMQPGAWVQSAALIEESKKLAVCYRHLAERLCVSFADAADWGVELAFDGVHFSPAGHAAFAKGLTAKLQNLE